MKVIIHGIANDDKRPDILALRAAWAFLGRKPGDVGTLEFENGDQYDVRRNKFSVAVWKVR